MAGLSLRLLGALQITLDGMPVTGLESDKERALLAYLAEESQQPHRREKLAGILWPERPEPAARNNLRRVLSNLRRLLGDRTQTGTPFLLVTARTVRFNPACDARIDSLSFASLLMPPGTQSSTRLEQAIDLYRGDFLEGFSLDDSPACEEWIVLCRERYQRMMMEALHALVEEYESQGRYERALQLAWKQLDLEPWWEEAHQQLIRLLALSGRRSEALAQYIKCRRLLAEELDAEPSAATTRLYGQIRDETLTGSVPAPEHRPGPTHNLPLTSGPFVGRETEIAEIQECLRDPACRLLSVVGAGGMGKTRLAVEAVSDWIAKARGTGLDRVALVSLDTVQTAGEIVLTIAQAVDLQLAAGAEPNQQLQEYLDRRRWLLILDSFEHQPDGARHVADILESTSRVKILVTSRVRLNLHIEQCFPVAGLEFAEHLPDDGEKARSFAAVELFLQAARRVLPGFEPYDADLAAISRVCRLVEGMPLGILLAAAWSDVLAPAEIAAETGKGLRFFESGWHDMPERQRSLRATFDWSWDLLSGREREVFQALSVFWGGFTRDAALQVADASLRDLKALTDKSLLQFMPSGRYQIHELLRQYAAGKLDSTPDAGTTARDRHCAYYSARLQRWEAELVGSRQQAALIEMEAESDNIRAAWSWAVEQAQVQRLDGAMLGLQRFYWLSGRFRQAEATFEAIASVAADRAAKQGADKATWLRLWIRALTWLSFFQRALGKRDDARRIQQQCLRILQDPALAGCDTRLERGILTFTVGLTDCMADYEQGRQRFQKAYSLYREIDRRWMMGGALNAWSTMSIFLGSFQDAKRRADEALAIFREMGVPLGAARSLRCLARIAWLEGRFGDAERLAREDYAVSLDVGTPAEAAFGLLNLGETLEKSAKFSEAHLLTEKSLALLSDLGHRNYITQAHSGLGSIDMHRGRYKEARDHAETGLALAREHGPRFCVGLNLLLLGCLDLADGAHAKASQLLKNGVAVYRDIGQRDDLSWGLATLALAALGREDTCAARQHLFDAFQTAIELGAVFPLLWALPATSLLLADRGEDERALELYALASRYPLVAKSHWFSDAAGNRLAAIAATLPPGKAAAARQRGQARDLEATVSELLAELPRSVSHPRIL